MRDARAGAKRSEWDANIGDRYRDLCGDMDHCFVGRALFRPARRLTAGSEVKYIRQPGPAHRAAGALAHAITMVRALEAMALRVLFQTGDEIPGGVRTAFAPTGARGPNRLRAFAGREWRLVAVPVVTPDLRLA